MKTLEEIQTMTQAALQKEKEETAKRLKEEEEEELKRNLDDDRYAKVSVSVLMAEIEKAASQGKHSFEIDMGTISGSTLSHRLQLEKLYIEKELKDFTPVFTKRPRIGRITNYDGETLDYNYYTALQVSFSW